MKTETRYDSKTSNLEFRITAENSAEEALIEAMKDRKVQPVLMPEEILPMMPWPVPWIRFTLKIAEGK